MMSSYDKLRELTELIECKPCSEEENQHFFEMLKNGGQLPDEVFQSSQDDKIFYNIKERVPLEKQQMYVLMRISTDLHFISTLIKIMLILGIIGAVAVAIFMKMG